MDGPGTLTALEDLLPPQVRTMGLFTGQHGHANPRLRRRDGYRQTYATQASAYLPVHLARAGLRCSGAAAFRPGRS